MKKMSKRILSVLIAVVLLFSSIPIAVFAQDEKDYIFIRTPEDFNQIRDNLAGSYVLLNDIDLSEYENWEPIGENENDPFIGVLDGNEHTVKNYNPIVLGKSYSGLFGYNSGVITNLNLESDILIPSYNNCFGGVVGYNNGVICNCKMNGSITISDGSGGLNVGGIVGYNKGYVKYCINNSNISETHGLLISPNLAGIIGYSEGGFVTCCYNTGKISLKNISWCNNCGGGIIANCHKTIIENCYNLGMIEWSTGGYSNFGGIAGYADSAEITNCYNYGQIPAMVTDGSSRVTSKSIFTGSATVTNCYYFFGLSADSSARALSKARFGDVSSFSDWDFENVWEMKDGRPELRKMQKYTNTYSSGAYVGSHIEFINSSGYKNLISNASFYNNVWKDADAYKSLAAGEVWDMLGVIGKPFSTGLKVAITANFPGCSIDDAIDNPYDLLLVDILASDSFKESSATKTVTEFIGAYDKFFSTFSDCVRSSDEWAKKYSDSFAEQMKKELKECLIAEKEYKMSENVSDFLKDYFSKQDAETLTKIFYKLDDCADIAGYISTGVDILNDIIDVIKAYVTAVAFYETTDEYFFTVMDIANQMMYNANNPIAAAYLSEALDKVRAIQSYDDCFSYAMDEVKKNGAEFISDIVKSLTSKSVVKGIASLLEVEPGNIGVLSFAYNTTYSIVDFLSANGEQGDLVKAMFSAALLEKELYDLTTGYADNLLKKETVRSAEMFDCAWTLLQAVNHYAFKTEASYATKRSLIARIITTFNSNYANSNTEAALYLANEWKKQSCHTGEYGLGSKIATIHCPVDVYLYDLNGNSVLEIVNNRIVKNDNDLTALVVDGKKTIVLPTDDYIVTIKAFDSGVMDYKILEITDNSFSREVDFYNILLDTNKEFNGKIPNGMNISNTGYSLSTENEVVTCDYDSRNICSNDEHSFGDWSVAQTATCVRHGYSTRTCSLCGKVEYFETDFSDCIDFNCDGICDVCGSKLENIIHPDDNHDGICDNCGEDFTKDCDCFCHSESKFMQFIYKIVRFLWKLFGIEDRHFCDCGKAHW